MSHLLKVTQKIAGASPHLPDYPLLPGDVLVRDEDGTYRKVAPGLGVGGFVLSAEQQLALEPTEGVVVIEGSL